jgi:hypothetical protein
VQDDAVKAARKSVDLTTSQYKEGTVSYLNVITVQTIALTDEVTAIQIRGRRMAAAVLLVQGLGGGWTEAQLPSPADVTKRDDPARVRPETVPGEGIHDPSISTNRAVTNSCGKAPRRGSLPPAPPPKK